MCPIYNDVTFQPNRETTCVFLKDFWLASLAFSSCSVCLIGILVLSGVLIRVSKVFKMENYKRFHKSHPSAKTIDGWTVEQSSVLIHLPGMTWIFFCSKRLSYREASQTCGHDTSRALFSLRNREHFLTIQRGLLRSLQNLGGHVSPVAPRSYVSAF